MHGCCTKVWFQSFLGSVFTTVVSVPSVYFLISFHFKSVVVWLGFFHYGGVVLLSQAVLRPAFVKSYEKASCAVTTGLGLVFPLRPSKRCRLPCSPWSHGGGGLLAAACSMELLVLLLTVLLYWYVVPIIKTTEGGLFKCLSLSYCLHMTTHSSPNLLALTTWLHWGVFAQPCYQDGYPLLCSGITS